MASPPNDLRAFNKRGGLPANIRFAMSYVPDPNSGCWLWIGASHGPFGYGAIRIPGGRVYAHRYSWGLHRGPIPHGFLVCHICDVPCCVNPNHLFLGSDMDNQRDKIRKGRGSQGERHPLAKITESQVIAIRQDTRTLREIASDYSLSKQTISSVQLRRTWRHIQ